MLALDTLYINGMLTLLLFGVRWTSFVHFEVAMLIALFFGATGIHEAGHPSLNFLIRPWTLPDIRDLLLIASCGVKPASCMSSSSRMAANP